MLTLELPRRKRPDGDSDGGDLIGVGAPREPRPGAGGGEASPPSHNPERRRQPATVGPRFPRR